MSGSDSGALTENLLVSSGSPSEEEVWVRAMTASVHARIVGDPCTNLGPNSAEICAMQADTVVKKWKERFGNSDIITEGSDG